MALQLLEIGLFIAAFAIATLRKVHLGVTMLAVACGVGVWIARMPLAEVGEGFPVSIMVLLAGVTYFFGIAQEKDTVDRVIEAVLGRVGHVAALLPFVFFGITAVVSAMGSPIAPTPDDAGTQMRWNPRRGQLALAQWGCSMELIA